MVRRFDSSVQEGRWNAIYHDPLPVGVIAVALMGGSAALLGIPVDVALLGAAFFGTALVYGVDRGGGGSPEDRVNRPNRVAWRRNRTASLQVELGLCLVGLLVTLGFLRWWTIAVAVVLGTVGLLHSFPLLPGGRRLKDVGGIKPFVVAGVWAVGAGLLPVLESGGPIPVAVAWLCVYRFAFVLPNVLLHDWADRKGDSAAGRVVWASRWSLGTLRAACTGLLAAAGVGAVVAVAAYDASRLLIVDGIGIVGMIAAVWSIRPGRSPLSAFLLDLLVGWPIVTWAAAAAGLA